MHHTVHGELMVSVRTGLEIRQSEVKLKVIASLQLGILMVKADLMLGVILLWINFMVMLYAYSVGVYL